MPEPRKKGRLESFTDAVSDELKMSVYKIPYGDVKKARNRNDETVALGTQKSRFGDIPLKNESGKTDPRILKFGKKKRK